MACCPVTGAFNKAESSAFGKRSRAHTVVRRFLATVGWLAGPCRLQAQSAVKSNGAALRTARRFIYGCCAP